MEPYYIAQSSLTGLEYFIGDIGTRVLPVGTTIGYYLGTLLPQQNRDPQGEYYMALNPSGSILIDGSNPAMNPVMFIQHACPSCISR